MTLGLSSRDGFASGPEVKMYRERFTSLILRLFSLLILCKDFIVKFTKKMKLECTY